MSFPNIAALAAVNFSIFLCHSVTAFLMSDRKLTFARSVMVWGIYAVIFATAGTVSMMNGVAPGTMKALFCVSIIVNLALFLLTSYGSMMKNIFLFATYVVFFMANFTFSRGMAQLFFPGSAIATPIIRNVISIAFIVLLWRFLRDAFRRATQNIAEGWGMLAAFAALSGAGFIYISMPQWSGTADIMFGHAMALALVILSAYVLVFRMIGFLNDEHDKKRAVEQARFFENELMAEREFVKLAREHHHDMRHHNIVLLDYLDRGDLDGIRSYLAEHDRLTAGSALPGFCKNQAANAVLRIAARYSQSRNISFSFRTEIPEELPLSAPEVGVVLGNLLENACESCRKCDGAFIEVNAETRNNRLYLEIKNSVAGSVEFQGDLPRTTKKLGGLGLTSVENVLRKHGGMMLCTQEENVFITRLILPL